MDGTWTAGSNYVALLCMVEVDLNIHNSIAQHWSDKNSGSLSAKLLYSFLFSFYIFMFSRPLFFLHSHV